MVTAAHFQSVFYEQIAPLSEVTLEKWQRVRGDFQVFQPESNPLVLYLWLIWAVCENDSMSTFFALALSHVFAPPFTVTLVLTFVSIVR